MIVICKKPFADALTGRSYTTGDPVPWQRERAEHYSALVKIVDDSIVPEPEQNAEVNATKGALSLAKEHGIDLSIMTGSGSDGRITKADVEALVNG